SCSRGTVQSIQVVIKFPELIRGAMSDTRKRDGGMLVLFQYQIGQLIYRMMQLETVPTLHLLRTGCDLRPHLAWNLRDRDVHVGRILRKLPGKKSQIAIDPVDDMYVFRAMAKKREKEDAALGYKVVTNYIERED